jgi:universal stress protein E
MNILKNILVATDFSFSSRMALTQAHRLSQWNGAKLHVLHVVDILQVRAYAEAFQHSLLLLEPRVEKQRSQELNQWVADSGVDATESTEAVLGMPLDLILRRLQEREASLLVLGARGESGEKDEAGDLALKCLRQASSKVLLVHPRDTGPFKVVVACIDFSETSREAARQASHVAELDGSSLHFIHVHASPKKNLFTPAESRDSASPFAVSYRDVLEKRLRAFVGDTGRLNVTFSLIQDDDSTSGITGYVRAQQADLLVLGNRGQSELSALLLGSTAETILREVPCSVLVIRPRANAS